MPRGGLGVQVWITKNPDFWSGYEAESAFKSQSILFNLGRIWIIVTTISRPAVLFVSKVILIVTKPVLTTSDKVDESDKLPLDHVSMEGHKCNSNHCVAKWKERHATSERWLGTKIFNHYAPI